MLDLTSHQAKKLIAQLQSGRQLAIRFHKYRANSNSKVLRRDTSLVLNALESKRAGHRLQGRRLADHTCVALGIMRNKIVARSRLAGEETK